MTCHNSTTKTCSKCNEAKDLSEFDKDLTRNGGVYHRCHVCNKQYKKDYHHSKNGLLSVIYGNQKSSSKRRNHQPPSYTLNEFRVWAKSHDKFHDLHNSWVESGYDKMMAPSADRFDDYKPYTLKNMQWMAWHENDKKGREDIKNGVNRKSLKSVVQMNKDGTFVAEHISISIAASATYGHRSHIGECCKGLLKTSGGYRWMYSLGIPIYNNEV